MRHRALLVVASQGIGMKWWKVVAALALSACAKHWDTRPVDPQLAIELTPERVERGAYLVGSIGACGGCHHGRPTDREFLENADQVTSVLGGTRANLANNLYIYAPNISSGPDGIGTWSDDEAIRAIRDGVAPDGRQLFGIMPFMTYRDMSDEDVRSIVAYLRTTPPVTGRLDREDDQISLLTKFAFSKGHDGVPSVPEPNRADPVAYGAYLAQIGHCGECHSADPIKPRDVGHPKWLAGSAVPFPMPMGKYPAPNLTPDVETGLGSYSAEQIKQALRDGKMLSGEMMQPPMSIFAAYYRNMTDEDLDALVAYLQSLAPVKGKSIPRKLNERGEAFAKLAAEKLAERQAAEAQPEPAATGTDGSAPVPGDTEGTTAPDVIPSGAAPEAQGDAP